MAELDELCKRMVANPGVEGFLIINSQGIAIRTSFDRELAAQYAYHIHRLASKARAITHDMDSGNELGFIRIRSKKHEIMIAPEKDYALIVVQK